MVLKNKKAIITGASRGIGLAIAKTLAENGVDVFITARDGLYSVETKVQGVK